MSEFDAVTRPEHYRKGRKIEPFAVMRDWDLPPLVSHALKYMSRLGRKGDYLEDLNKAINCLVREREFYLADLEASSRHENEVQSRQVSVHSVHGGEPALSEGERGKPSAYIIAPSNKPPYEDR